MGLDDVIGFLPGAGEIDGAHQILAFEGEGAVTLEDRVGGDVIALEADDGAFEAVGLPLFWGFLFEMGAVFGVVCVAPAEPGFIGEWADAVSFRH
jgi:hypothetical protein